MATGIGPVAGRNLHALGPKSVHSCAFLPGLFSLASSSRRNLASSPPFQSRAPAANHPPNTAGPASRLQAALAARAYLESRPIPRHDSLKTNK